MSQALVTDKLSASHEDLDRGGFEYTKKPLDQANALWRRNVAGMVQKRPHQRDFESACNNGRNQNIDVALSEFPVGPVQGKKCWSYEIEQANNQLGNHISMQRDVFEKALKAAIF